jgi:DNA-binding Lrp family transcriptional regulator
VPDRIIRVGILTSDAVNSLSWAGEVFYRRLMSVVDDFGRYDGRASVLRAALYALKVDRVSEPDIGKWIRECEEAGLVRRYTVDSKPFLEVTKFGQKVRAKFSKWPDPPTYADTCQQVLADAPVVVVGDVFDGESVAKKPRRKPATKVPDSFDVTDEMAQWAVVQGLSAERVLPETEKFLDHNRKHDESMSDWGAGWRNWIRKAVEFSVRK